MIARYGGRYLTKGGSHRLLEGGHWKPERVVIIEFPDMESLNRWYTAPEYQPLVALRRACTSDLDMLITLEGYDGVSYARHHGDRRYRQELASAHDVEVRTGPVAQSLNVQAKVTGTGSGGSAAE